MTVLATSGFATLIPLLFVLACPLMMILMMRGMHGRGRSSRDPGDREKDTAQERSLEEHYHRREALEEEIAAREQAQPGTAAGPGTELTASYSKEA